MGERHRILIVDDDDRVRWFLSEAIRSMGLEPESAASPVEGLRRAEADSFDGIVLDWQMPEMNGTDLARRIRKTPLNSLTPIVLLTAYPSAESVQESLAAGVNFFLPKPVSVEQLRNLLDPARGFASEERRRAQRTAAPMSVMCRWEGSSSSGRVVNLSADGASLTLTGAPPMNSWVSLEFHAPGEAEPVEVTGQVTRVTLLAGPSRAGAGRVDTAREIGIRFVGLGEEIANRLNSVGRTLPPTAHPVAGA